ncbi:alpha/beta-hydrolase superfamily protein [Forsythia ovata]|uniref:Alpha/beta-hydrolase superfamily protein n=1 Tax=Forsythia ovata TaxID=205694 RepID=A0ABD1VNK5_9LAMI
MSAISNFRTVFQHGEFRATLGSENRLGLTLSINQRAVKTKIVRTFHEVALNQSRNAYRGPNILMALVDERLPSRSVFVKPADILAYDLVQGADVRWSYILDKSVPEPPTAVLLHGILGSRKNWGTFARRLAKEFPKWQFLLVDLRCHGDSTSLKKRGPHTVSSAALDCLKATWAAEVNSSSCSWSQLWWKRVVQYAYFLSYCSSVALSMVEQVAKPLARPVRVWVLDATPGKVRAGADGDDHPAELISFLSKLPKEVSSKKDVVNALVQDGFSMDVAQWVVTNLRQTRINGTSSSSFSWVFDLNGIAEMYQSYEVTNMWKIVEDVPRGCSLLIF